VYLTIMLCYLSMPAPNLLAVHHKQDCMVRHSRDELPV